MYYQCFLGIFDTNGIFRAYEFLTPSRHGRNTKKKCRLSCLHINRILRPSSTLPTSPAYGTALLYRTKYLP